MIGNLFEKLKEARRKIEESKKKLNDIIVVVSVENGAIKVVANANKSVKSIEISETFLKEADKESFEELLLTAVNKALDEAAKKGEAEMKEITKDILPNFPGLV
ncbi:MAG: YbaB/EbfC family nucleoid-associated protein [Bacteroidetes bacterium]|nr:YbaB/EbfC family nucleoid-associated protein [Bacteroidota bacterium]MBL7105300.1 YbaB/EbfC family nucleoid-associated protein [Bacteroidales bacterium]